MAKRGQESFQKRAREKARQEKQAEKRARRQSGASEVDTPTRAEQDALMEEFAMLSERYEANQISTDDYNDERHRIFVALGLETDE